MIAEVKKYTEQFQIEHLLKKNPYELSGGEKQRVAICRALINNPDLMDKLSPDGQKAIAEAMDKSVMTPLASGFIDFELREGFRGNTDGLTSDDISKLREHDPGFGKIIGIDTTKFYTSGPEKNVTIIKLDYEDIKPALSIDQKGFEKENIVPGSIRAYKEFGQSMKVDGMRFGVTNLVTFEEKLKGEDLPYRTTCVMDDSGRVRGFLEVQEPDRRIPMDLQAKLDAAPGTETHFASLDRTDPENRACIPGLRNATPEIREAFFDKVEAKMPEFMEKFCDNMKEDFLERKDALIAKLDEAKQERAIVHIDLNKVELVRENVLSELADARTGMQDIAEQPDVERYENDTEIEPDEKEDKPESAVDEPEDKKEEQELAVEKPEDTENNIDQKEPNEEQTEIEKPEDKEKIEQDTTDENDHTEKEKPDQVETDNQEIEREENDQPDQKEDTTEFSEKEFPEDDSADSQTDKAEQTEIEKDPEEPEDEDGREEEAHGVTISEKENEEDRVKEDAVASSKMEQKAPQKEDSGIDNQDKNTEKPMDSTDFKEDIRPDEQPDSNEIEGLEWKHVFIIDCVEGVCPSPKAETAEELEEERRLFYVAMTRAKEHLYLCYYKAEEGKTVVASPYIM